MTTRDEFKVAFLRVCADQGMSTAETIERVEKAAELLEKKALGPAASIGLAGMGMEALSGLKDLIVKTPQSVISTLGPYAAGGALAAGIGIPIAAGAASGIGLQRATADDTSVEEAKANELIGEYDRLAEQARRHAALRQFQQKVLPHAGRRF